MAQNLNYGTRVNGTLSTENQSDYDVIEKYCYGDDDANCTTDGGLYQWAEAMHFPSECNSQALADCFSSIGSPHQGICPSGWHIPSATDWTSLITDLGNDEATVASQMKLNNTPFSGWNASTYNDGNSSGFSVFPAGVRNAGGGFGVRGSVAHFWVAQVDVAIRSYNRYLNGSAKYLSQLSDLKIYGYSVRCVQNP